MNEGTINPTVGAETGGGSNSFDPNNNPFGVPYGEENTETIPSQQEETVKEEPKKAEPEKAEEKEWENPFGEPVVEEEEKAEDRKPKAVSVEEAYGDGPKPAFEGETEVVDALLGVFEKEYGWSEIPKDVRPKNAKDFVEYVAAIIAQNSEPEYPHPSVQMYAEYVKNGGNPEQYFNTVGQFNYSNINLDNPYDCSRAVGALLKANGYSDQEISDSIQEYNKAGILKKEAAKAASKLQQASQYQQQALVEEQKQQQAQYSNYVKNLHEGIGKSLVQTNEIMGTPLSQRDRQQLFEYMVRPTKNGASRFEIDYMSHPQYLIHAAWICMKGQDAFANVKRSAQKNAMDNFRNTIRQHNVKHREAPRTSPAGSSKSSVGTASYWNEMLQSVRGGGNKK